jgi:hypothetical protein
LTTVRPVIGEEWRHVGGQDDWITRSARTGKDRGIDETVLQPLERGLEQFPHLRRLSRLRGVASIAPSPRPATVGARHLLPAVH